MLQANSRSYALAQFSHFVCDIPVCACELTVHRMHAGRRCGGRRAGVGARDVGDCCPEATLHTLRQLTPNCNSIHRHIWSYTLRFLPRSILFVSKTYKCMQVALTQPQRKISIEWTKEYIVTPPSLGLTIGHLSGQGVMHCKSCERSWWLRLFITFPK